MIYEIDLLDFLMIISFAAFQFLTQIIENQVTLREGIFSFRMKVRLSFHQR